MKKVLVAAAGLMLVGTMASSAMAEFYFSGDARARFYYEDNYLKGPTPLGGGLYKFTEDQDETFYKSRVRLNIKADTKGGAYAVTQFVVGDATWNSNDSSLGDVEADRAYIGVPFGPVTVEAGRQGRDITPWLFYGADVDGLDVNYKQGNTTLVVFADMLDENTTPDTYVYDSVTDTLVEFEGDNDDDALYGFYLGQKFEGGWGLAVGAALQDLQESADDTAFGGTVQLTGALGSVALTAEMAYQEEEWHGNTDDDGYGGYLAASVPVGPVNIDAGVGFTVDGYQWEGGEWGPFEMIGGVNQIATGVNPSAEGETIIAYMNPSFQATEKVNLGAIFAYADVDTYADIALDDYDMFEVSALIKYAVVDGAVLKARAGWLGADDRFEDDPFGAGLSLEVSF